MIAILVSVATSHAKPTHKDRYHLIVEGSFLGQRNISCTVYKMDQNGTFYSEERTKVRKHFQLRCKRGEKYIVRFQDKKGNTKFLMIDASKAGYFGVNVDFTRGYDAVIKYTKNGYSLTPLTASNMQSSIANK